MNCKPNQRAVLTRTLGMKEMIPFLGMVFTVRYIVENRGRGPVWSVDPDNRAPHNVHRYGDIRLAAGEPITEVADAVLTPLPDDPDPVEQDVKEIEHV